MLSIFEKLPDGLLDCEANELHTILTGPSLIHLSGDRPEPLFVSVLLHGNEVTGWLAIREILKHYEERRLPRAVSLFIGNVSAARDGVRHLDGQPDYNRIWRADSGHEEDKMVKIILEQMVSKDIFACIDVHNNSGRNPHYACVNRLATPFFDLATTFSNTIVYFLKPDTVLSLAFSNICPSVTIECGKPSEPHGMEHARDYILSILARDELEEHSRDVHNLNVFHTVAIVKLKQGVTVGLEETDCALQVSAELDQLNFSELESGTRFGQVRNPDFIPIEAINEFGKDVANRYFEIKDGYLCTTSAVMPSMLTLDMDIIRQDCLCYLLERMDLSMTLST